MTALFNSGQWCALPKAYWTIQYEYKRSGRDMQYCFYWKIWLGSAGSYYYNGIMLKLFIDNSEKNITVKGYNSGEKGWSYEGTTEWYTVSEKTSGSVSFNAQLYDTSAGKTEATSSEFKLYVSPAASVPTLSKSTVNFGESITIYTNRVNSAFTHHLYYSVNGGAEVGITSGIESSYTWKVPLSLAANATDGSATITFRLYTFNDGTNMGSNTVSFKAVVAKSDETKPALNMSLMASSDFSQEDWVKTEFIQKRHYVLAEMTASTKQSAGVKSFSLTIDGDTKTVSNPNGFTARLYSEILQKSGNITVKGKVVDSRGISSDEVSQNITVIPYGKPTVRRNKAYGGIVCARYDTATESLSDSGTALKLILGADWYSLAHKENTANVQVQCISGDSYSDWIDIEATSQGGGSENNYVSSFEINTVVPGITLATNKTYTIKIKCTDRFGNYDLIDVTIPTARACLHLGKGGNKAAFGKRAEHDNALEITEEWDFYYKGEVANIPEMGHSSDGWMWEKYPNGFARCYKNVGCAILSGELEPWGNVYETNKTFGGIELPFVFLDTYGIYETKEISYSDKAAFWIVEGANSGVTATHTSEWALARPNDPGAAPYFVWVTVCVAGWLKKPDIKDPE